MANFFVQQEDARRRSRHLVIAFHIVVILTALATAFFYVIVMHLDSREGEALGTQNQESLIVFGVVWFMVWAIAILRRGPLKEGGAKIASLAGGVEVRVPCADPAQKRLLNIVEEMSIAAGMPIPHVYVLPEEDSINAFAAGSTTHDACVAVSKGALDKLSREELQGVVAHEFSHILNGDMRLNLHLLGYLYGLTSIADIGRYLLRSRSNSGRKRDNGALIGVGLLIIGGIGLLLAKLLKAAVSRNRERLADASAVQFTRNPQGIGGALRKIWRESNLAITAPRAGEISHFYFHWPSGFTGLFSTHPPILERLRALGVDTKDVKPDSTPSTLWGAEETAGFAPSAHKRELPEWDALSVGWVFYLWFEPSVGLGPVEALKRHEPSLDETKLLEIYQFIEKASNDEKFALLEKAIFRLRQESWEVKKAFLRKLKTMIEEDQIGTGREFIYYRLLQLELGPREQGIKLTPDSKLWDEVETAAYFFGHTLEAKNAHQFAEDVMKQLGKSSTRLSLPKITEIHQALKAMALGRPTSRVKIYDAIKYVMSVYYEQRAEGDLALRLLALVLEVPKVRG